ncbi:uncharacterized protein [Dermacentor andersoni]|uniref:uncharacterized protein n=1 Tax=Dermacentor andersoni TaxID=34620 RepID=UPI003B3BC2F9
MTSMCLVAVVFSFSALHAVSSLRIVGHAIGGSEMLEREKFDISSKADPKDGAQGDLRKLTEKQAVVMFQVKPVNDDESEGMGADMKEMPMATEKGDGGEGGRSDPVSDTSKAVQQALGNAVAEFLPAAMSDTHR